MICNLTFLSANPRKWSNILEHLNEFFECVTQALTLQSGQTLFDHFVRLALEGLCRLLMLSNFWPASIALVTGSAYRSVNFFY